jgi:hypothetical protein
MLSDRVTVFRQLIEYYDRLQKMVHEYLESKRLEFNRFFFLTDAQFLDFLMQVNSNLDFSTYFQMMFNGAQKLFVTQISQPNQSFMESSIDPLLEISGPLEIEARLEQFLA